MKSKRYQWLLITLLLTHLLSAQTFTIKGHIYDDNMVQLNHVVIQNNSGKKITSTNNEGYFEFHSKDSIGVIGLYLDGYYPKKIHFQASKMIGEMLVANEEHLGEIKIKAYSTDKTERETAGGITVLSGKKLSGGNGMSMQNALNSVPGVRMDQSTLSDSRISIRGNGVRSPWGIRDIKIYIDDIPLTEADGTSRIEGLDIHDLGRAEIIRGPASSIYGGGVGGVINFYLDKSPYGENSIELNGLVGSNGLARMSGIYRYGGRTFNSYVSYGHQWYEGYRQHSSDYRDFITGNFQFFPSDKRKISLLINRTTQKSQIPGALTLDEVQQDRKQASKTNLDKIAGRDETWTRIGVAQRYKFGDKLSNTSSIFTYFYDLDHPLPYAYLHSFYEGYGGRTHFDYQPGFKILDTKFVLGAEYNQAKTLSDQYVNNHGTEGNIWSSANNNYRVFNVFFQAITKLTKSMDLALGVNYSDINYRVKNYISPIKSGNKHFLPKASPRIALSQNFGEYLSLHGSVSMGYSPPNASEIANIDGSINQKTQAQNAINYEIDVKGALFNSRFLYDLSVFKMDMTGELIAQSPLQGVTIYQNAGKTTHNGVELALVWQPIKTSDNFIVKNLRLQTSTTYSDFRFKDYKVRGAGDTIIAKYDNNFLTGIAPWTISFDVDLELKFGFYFNFNGYYNNKSPLNDANTAYNSSWFTINSKVGYKTTLWKHFVVDLYVGSENMSNEMYSSFVALNAASYGGSQPAYFNPSPGRTFYGGLSLKYLFTK